MINLLKNEKIVEKNSGINRNEEAMSKQGEPQGSSREQAVRGKIERYKDPEGLTVSKLNFGLWWVKNREKMIRLGVIFLIVVSVITWSIFIFSFGYYVFFGMKQDEKVLQGMTAGSSVNHETVVAMSAKDLRFQEAKALKVLDNRYDFLVLVTNPNDKFYAEFDYYFIGDGKETGKRHGFILPNESKYFFQLGQDFKTLPNDIKFKIADIKWMRIDARKFPDWKNFVQERFKITTSDAHFFSSRSTVLAEKLDLNELKFTVVNSSIFNYWQVNLKILLYSRGNIVGVNEYIVEDLMNNESRDVAMTWPGRFSIVDDIEIIPELDITKSDIYINYDGGAGSVK